MTQTLEVYTSSLINKLSELRDQIYGKAQKILAECMPGRGELVQSRSALNLAHCAALRRRDLRGLQEELAEAGLSSLGRCESHVMATLDRAISVLQRGYGIAPAAMAEGYPSYNTGKSLLELNATRLFGTKGRNRKSRIMATLPTEAAGDARFIQDLVTRGMDCAHQLHP